MSDALLPCPFCGGETKGEWGGSCSDNPYVITCPGCPATMIAYGESDHAIAAWNTRVTPAEVDALRVRVERMETLLREAMDSRAPAMAEAERVVREDEREACWNVAINEMLAAEADVETASDEDLVARLQSQGAASAAGRIATFIQARGAA